MASILLTLHILIAVALTASVLLQKSEGGLGGLGGGMSSIMNSQSSSNFITKLTSYLAAGFLCTSISLAVFTAQKNSDTSIIESDIIEKNNILEDNEPQVPIAD